jgi:5'-nucleotidase
MMTQRRVLSSCFAFVLVLVLALGAQNATHVLILHTNDIHGHVLPENGAGGLAIIAAMVKQARPDLLLDAGDMFTGTLLSDTFYGEPVMALMNRMGYSVSVLGNHEFDYGIDMLRNRVRQADFPILSANVQLPVKEVQKFTILKAKGIRFGIVGLTTEETPTTTHPKNLKNVQIKDLVKSLEETLPAVRPKADFIIALTHITPEEELRVARAFPEIRLIISGHTHAPLPAPILEKETLIVRTGSFGTYLGRVDLDFDSRKVRSMSEKLIAVKDVPPDPDALKTVERYRSSIEDKMNALIGMATAPMPKTILEESPLFNLVTDAFRAKTHTQIAMTNPGGIRTNLPAGPITYGKIFEILPFENTLVTMKITGAQVKRSLAVGVTAVSGVKAVFDYNKPKDERLVSVTLADDSPIVDDAWYTVTVNDFMQAGGDGYVEFARGQEIADTGIRLRDIVSEYISNKKTVTPLIDGRVQVLR